MASVAAHHAEWLSLVDVSGPFLSVPVLKEALPNGLDAHDPHVAAEVQAALEQWDGGLPEFGWADTAELHLAFVRFVLERVLGFEPDVLIWDDEMLAAHTFEVSGWGAIAPDAVVVDGDRVVMLLAVQDRDQPVDAPMQGMGMETAQTRMVQLLRVSGVRLGLVTDGERWTLVSCREGENPGYATWWSSLWGEEKITLQAFRTLLHQDRFLTLGEDETIGALLDRSAEDQRELTTKLGNQTLEAVEILIRTIDRIDQERGGELLRDVEEEQGIAELYDAAVTVMMRLIFLFYAEENGLLPMSEPLYVERYAVSSLRERLQGAADLHGEEVLESTHDGWPRLLSTWRAVFGGVQHGEMTVAPYGGSLFEPDRYPFLEGRQPDSSWLIDEADPLRIDNRTILHLLNALQTLDEGGQRRKLSFRALDVEQIGHIYEGMLDHTAERARGWVLGLSGTGGREPEIELDELESFDDDKALLDFLKDQTGRGVATNKKWIADAEAAKAIDWYGTTWAPAFADADLESRARRFAKLIRADSTGAPTAFQPGSVYVTDSSHRGATGAHYTPRSLTEELVAHTLDPLVHIGSTKGTSGGQPELRRPEEILALNICDPACGSGAFLVQACRYLADKLVESRLTHGDLDEDHTEADIIDARRQVAEGCLHGVDINPMACEMAKLSLWLITLAYDRPFTFLDHAIRCGDSLVGIKDLDQLVHLHVDPDRGRQLHRGTLFDIEADVKDHTQQAAQLLDLIAATPSRDLGDIDRKAHLDRQARAILSRLRTIANAVVATHLTTPDSSSYHALMLDRAPAAAALLNDPDGTISDLEAAAGRPLFHWPLEFPDVFMTADEPGFDAFIANPPFLGGQAITGTFGTDYRNHIVEVLAHGTRGSADLVAYFFLRAASLTSRNGRLGMLATNTIAQGDTRKVGLDQLSAEGWAITRAVKSQSWPGIANLEIAKLWLSRGPSTDPATLDGHPVRAITTSLNPKSRVTGTPRRLAANAGQSFQGSNILGLGFTMSPEDAQALIEANSENRDVLFPYLNGKDLNDHPAQRASRWVINFFDWPLEQARRYPDCLETVERLVKPERQRKTYSTHASNHWWQYERGRPELYSTIQDLDRVMVLTRHSKMVMPAWVPTGAVYSEATVVFACDDDTHFGILTSGFHYWWAVIHASTLETRIRYTPSDCFETFPRPEPTAPIGTAGRDLHEYRQRLMVDGGQGLTATYNRYHDPSDTDPEIAQLRQLHVELDEAVRAAYGWDDLALDHDFHPTDQGIRYTFAPDVRTEVLDRLRELNFTRYIDEAEHGLHADQPQLVTDPDGTLRLVSNS